jgi:predicted DNA-binding transcriptional regulator AlpA
MSHAKFCELVRSGALPTSKMIGDLERWEVQEIRAIISGDARQPAEDIEL